MHQVHRHHSNFEPQLNTKWNELNRLFLNECQKKKMGNFKFFFVAGIFLDFFFIVQ